MLVESSIEVVLQVNGKVRGKLTVPATITNDAFEKLALADPKVQEFIAGKAVKKIVVVPGKLVNIVAS